MLSDTAKRPRAVIARKILAAVDTVGGCTPKNACPGTLVAGGLSQAECRLPRLAGNVANAGPTMRKSEGRGGGKGYQYLSTPALALGQATNPGIRGR